MDTDRTSSQQPQSVGQGALPVYPSDQSFEGVVFSAKGNIYRLSSWDQGMDLWVRKRWGGGWQKTLDPGASVLVEPPRKDRQKGDGEKAERENQGENVHDQGCYALHVPCDVVELCLRFHYMQISVLQVLRRVRGAADLARTDPVLFWLAACAVGLGRIPLERAQELFAKKRRRMVRHLIGRDTVFSPRLLRKIKLGRADWFKHHGLMRLIRTYGMESSLQHYTCIDMDSLIRVLHRNPFQYPFFRDIMAQGEDSKKVFLDVDEALRLGGFLGGQDLEERYVTKHPSELPHWTIRQGHASSPLIEVGEQAGQNRVETRLRQLTTLDAFRDFVDRLHDKVLEPRYVQGLGRTAPVNVERLQGKPVPFPLLPGNEVVQPITTVEELQREGRIMHHCVISYVQEMLGGKISFYAVHAKERGTLALEHHGRGFRIREFRLARNDIPSQESKTVVDSWLVWAEEQLRSTQCASERAQNKAQSSTDLVLVLSLERCLVSTMAVPHPRPGLKRFLDFCHLRFDRIVIHTPVTEECFRALAHDLASRGLAPKWFADVEWSQPMGRVKQPGIIPGCAGDKVFVVDEQHVRICPEQHTQWVRIKPFLHPDSANDDELERAGLELEKLLDKKKG